MTEEEKQVDFDKRKKDAVLEMDEVLKKYELGISLVFGGMPHQLKPMIHYTDTKKYEETLNRKGRRAKSARGK